MKLEWHLVILCSFLFNCWQGLSRWTSRLCAHKGKIFIWKMANNAQNYVGEVLPAKFLSETCSVNMRWSLRRRIGILCLYFPLNKSTKIPTNFTMHHARNQKKSIRRRTFIHQIYSLKSSWHNLDYQLVGPVFWCNALQSGSRPRFQV